MIGARTFAVEAREGSEGGPVAAGRSSRPLLTLIDLYRRFVSPLLPPLCRFYPSCSVYAAQAIGRYGPLRGGSCAVVRLLKCHPLHPGGFDPVK